MVLKLENLLHSLNSLFAWQVELDRSGRWQLQFACALRAFSFLFFLHILGLSFRSFKIRPDLAFWLQERGPSNKETKSAKKVEIRNFWYHDEFSQTDSRRVENTNLQQLLGFEQSEQFVGENMFRDALICKTANAPQADQYHGSAGEVSAGTSRGNGSCICWPTASCREIDVLSWTRNCARCIPNKNQRIFFARQMCRKIRCHNFVVWKMDLSMAVDEGFLWGPRQVIWHAQRDDFEFLVQRWIVIESVNRDVTGYGFELTSEIF